MNHLKHVHWRRLGATSLVGAALLLGACATTPAVPTAALEAARTAISTAERMDADEYAAADLDTARQALMRAERLLASGDDERHVVAERLARQARVEAELAIARTESLKADEINRDLARSNEALAAEMKRAGESQ